MIPRRLEHRLIKGARAGDADAIQELIRAHQEALYAFILRMSGNPGLAEDVVQEAFVRVIRNLHRFDPQFRFSTWLFTIAKRLYVNAAQKHRPLYDTDAVASREDVDLCPRGWSARHEAMDNARSLIDEALASLNRLQREVILLFHQQCWPINAIAEHLCMPEGTVKSHLHRARKRMQRYIVADEKRHRQVQEIWS
jgi:RNA polymerase sigma-70 factor (ECF subfamily)